MRGSNVCIRVYIDSTMLDIFRGGRMPWAKYGIDKGETDDVVYPISLLW